MKHVAEARLGVEACAAAGAKVGAKGEASFSLLEHAQDGWANPAALLPRRPAMAIPRKRRR